MLADRAPISAIAAPHPSAPQTPSPSGRRIVLDGPFRLIATEIHMSDLTSLEQDIAAAIAAASDERALEAVRVAALGKKGSVSERLKGLGAMDPEARKTAGAALNALKDRVSALHRGAARRARRAGAGGAAALRDDRRHPAAAPGARRHRASGHAGLGRGDRHLRRHGFFRRRGAAHRDRLVQFRRAQHAAGASGAAGARHLLFQPEGGRLAHGAAHAYLAGADPLDGNDGAADPHHRARPHLPLRFRPDAHADVPPGRGPRHRRDDASRPPEGDARSLLPRPSSRSTR